MNKQLIKLIGAAACAAFITTTSLCGADTPPNPGAANPARRATTQAYPFRGTVDAVNTTAKTITLGGKKSERVLHVTPESVLEKDGKPAKLEEVFSGDYAKGLVSRPDGSREILVKASFGPKPGKKKSDSDTAAN